jgi:type I restriction enzyme, R subunit
MSIYNEDTLVQQTTAEYLHYELGWDTVYAFNTETLGLNGTLGRQTDREVVLTRYLLIKLKEFNPGLPEAAYDDAVRQIVDFSISNTTLVTNREKHNLLKDGVQVSYRNNKDELKKEKLRIFNFNEPKENHFLCVRELWVQGEIYRRRADIVCFVNGIPLVFLELKNISRSIRHAYEENLADYKDTIPHLFHHNAFIVLANGDEAKVGTISSRFEHFYEWKRLDEEDTGVVDMETLLKGVCNKNNLIDLFENFILFDESKGSPVKILAQNHQFLGVNRAIKSVKNREDLQRKLGVFWHTQGSGKSYSILFFSRKVHRKLGGNFTFLICTDREDLDSQIYKTFAGCGLVDNDRDPCRASSGDHLKELLGQHKAYIFTLIQKFNKDVDVESGYSTRDDIIVISDEAHRTQYGRLALNMRNALPNASYIGFTGTPLFKNDEITRQVFGEYVSTYPFQRAVKDGATVPLYYDPRGEKLGIATNDINERIAEKLEEFEINNIDVELRLERELKRDYHIVTAEKRLDQVARDFVSHYSTSWETGKAMLVCIDKITCVRMYNLINKYWLEQICKLESNIKKAPDQQEEMYKWRQINWMKETKMAVVVSEEQGEVAKFKKWDLDIIPHRKLIKAGFGNEDGDRIDIETAFKKDDHPFRIVIVCAMWLTGFDVPSLSTLYLDKPLKAHTLMQTIARANRVNEGKNNGLIVDYCGMLKSLRAALASYSGQGDSERDGENDPAKPADEVLLADLAESISLVRSFLDDRDASLNQVIEKNGFQRNAAIVSCKEAANENDGTRKRFEVMCREVFKKFKACLTLKGINNYRKDYDAINIIYRSLQKDREKADISDIIRQLHEVVDQAISTTTETTTVDRTPFNIAEIDFDRLRKEFERNPAKKTTVQNLKQAIDERLKRLLAKNLQRIDYQKHFEKLVSDYNNEKDQLIIEKTFEALLNFVKDLGKEEDRAMREGLDEETLAIFDLLKKPELAQGEIKKIKKVSSELLQNLKTEKLKIDHWREKEATRDAIRTAIHDFLWSEDTGLPIESFSEEDVKVKAEEVFQHVFRVYPSSRSPIFTEAV